MPSNMCTAYCMSWYKVGSNYKCMGYVSMTYQSIQAHPFPSDGVSLFSSVLLKRSRARSGDSPELPPSAKLMKGTAKQPGNHRIIISSCHHHIITINNPQGQQAKWPSFQRLLSDFTHFTHFTPRSRPLIPGMLVQTPLFSSTLLRIWPLSSRLL